MKRVLITGATTTIGEAIVQRFVTDPDVEHVLAVGVEPEAVAWPGSQEKLTYRRFDLTRSRGIRTLLYGPAQDMRIDAIVHTVLHRRARDSGERIHALNVESTREMLLLAEDHPTITRFVFRSFGDVYKIRANQPSVIAEDHPLNLAGDTPQWIRDRVEADLTVCTRMGMSQLTIAVLRCAECPVPASGSQLFDYLTSRVCFRPFGFDPVINLLSMPDLTRALQLALHSDAQGVFNVPGKDTLPLSRVIELAGRREIPAPGAVLSPLYRLRTLALEGVDFRYDLNEWRFHIGNVLDGRRAKRVLGYRPESFIDWDRIRRAVEVGPGV